MKHKPKKDSSLSFNSPFAYSGVQTFGWVHEASLQSIILYLVNLFTLFANKIIKKNLNLGSPNKTKNNISDFTC